MRLLLTGIVLSLLSHGASAQKNCELQLDKDSIQVYSCDATRSKFKAVQARFTLNASFDQVWKMLKDIDRLGDWQYETVSAKLLKRISDREIIYHTEVNAPVVSNRDFVINLSMTQPAAREMQVRAVSIPDYLPPTKDVVRVPMSEAVWHIREETPGRLSVVYNIELDLGGTLPAWLVNMLAHKATYETFKRMREQIGRYRR